MAIVLAILTCALILLASYLIQRWRGPGAASAETTAADGRAMPSMNPAAEPVWVAGYRLPERLYYHVGHTWAWVISPHTVAVGLDDFGQRVIGSTSQLKLPSLGSWLRQGANGFSVAHNGRSANLLSPVEGEVVEINADVKRDPTLVERDPYGHGWLFKVRCPHLASNLRNLLSGSLARRWTEDAADQLELELMAIRGSVLQDGGAPARDFADHLQPDEWERLTHEFFRT